MTESIFQFAQSQPAGLGLGTWWVPLLITVGAMVLGLRDVVRLSPTRIYAVASVCFRESIRRKVLLIIPLAIAGVLGVTLFQRAFDELDAVRQTLKFCLFATGLILVLTLIILSCTNLPREIDSRVIYTIVTKPTTRLEIVLGKIVGFSGVSLTVLVTMGVFTWLFLHAISFSYQRDIAAKLETGNYQAFQKSSLEHYQRFGLLNARRLASASSVAVVSSLPREGDRFFWIPFGMRGEALVPVEVDRDVLQPIFMAPDNDPNPPRLVLEVTATHRARAGMAEPDESDRPFIAPFVDQGSEQGRGSLRVSILNDRADMIIDASQINGVGRVLPSQGEGTVRMEIPRALAGNISQYRRIFVQILGEQPWREFGIGPQVVRMYVQYPDGRQADLVVPMDGMFPDRQVAVLRGRQGRGGQQIEGAADGNGTVGYYRFRNVRVATSGADVGFELRVMIERSGIDPEDESIDTRMRLTVFNRQNPSQPAAELELLPESNRVLFGSLPASALAGGDFDIAVRSLTNGHWISVGPENLQIVTNRQPFALNLAKSLLVMWMMSLLIIIVSIFCSTFLSWPIATVLTLVILLGRWVVVQLGDSLSSGMGNQVVVSMGLRDAAVSRAVAQSVDGLTEMLRLVATVLPDISRFASIEDIERGVMVPLRVLSESGGVLLMFGLPLVALSYVFFRYKEVAP